jgi:hypothetical protein
MKTLQDIAKQTWCRIVHGHVMVKIGDVKDNKALWMCARCIKCEALHTII